MAKHYVFSTIANDQTYVNWAAGEGGVNTITAEVEVKGGHGVANDRLVTPLGVVTEVSDEQLAQLEQNFVFQMHKKKGFLVVRQKSADPEKISADMNHKDPSAPLTEADFIQDKAA
jgi:hypothetical protein